MKTLWREFLEHKTGDAGRPAEYDAAMNRRDFVQTAAVPALAGLRSAQAAAQPAKTAKFTGQLCLFSKHVPWLTGKELASAVKQLGFDGIDLTARPGGHVLPEEASSAMPPLVEAIRSEDVKVPMITTALLNASDATARPILSTAGRLGIPYAKLGYYRYRFRDLEGEMAAVATQLRGLVDLAGECKIQLGYHNHSGYVGAPLWDIAKIIDGWDPQWIGYYFDIRHAVVEGGDAGWKIATLLAAPRLKMVAVKDFYWEKGPKGWVIHNCPLGQGMVDWPKFLAMLAAAKFAGPVSLHVEYEPGGASETAKRDAMLKAAEQDLQFLRAQFNAAYAAPSPASGT